MLGVSSLLLSFAAKCQLVAAFDVGFVAELFETVGLAFEVVDEVDEHLISVVLFHFMMLEMDELG
jgi:hypothetical protein